MSLQKMKNYYIFTIQNLIMDYTGHKINKYQVIRLIGEGGMASVYEAKHEILGTKVAIKILNPILSANKQIRERFLNEAKMMASFQHPNITNIIDFEENEQFLAIIMEFLEGQDLSDQIKSGKKMSDGEINHLFDQILSAFQYAHEKGIVHRDIKPSNIFILPNGHAKVLDFGIAKLFGQGNEMTQTGTQMGTPVYMSPEQVRGEKSIDHRSDIYSLGVTLFYAINGVPPYDTATGSQFDIFNKIVYEPLPAINSESELAFLVTKACQKERDNRFQSCSEWLEAMRELPTSNKKSTTAAKKTDNSGSNDRTIIETPVSVDQTTEAENEKTNSRNNATSSPSGKTKKNKMAIFLVLFILIIAAGIGVYVANENGNSKNSSSDAQDRDEASSESAPVEGAPVYEEPVYEEPIYDTTVSGSGEVYSESDQFWCEGDHKYIPIGWVNDGYCDCPTNCEDDPDSAE